MLADFDRALTDAVTTAAKANDVAVPVTPILNDSGFSDLLTEIADTAAQDRVEVPVTPVLDPNAADILAAQVQGVTEKVKQGGTAVSGVFDSLISTAVTAASARFGALGQAGTAAMSKIGVSSEALGEHLKGITAIAGGLLAVFALFGKSLGVFTSLGSEVKAFQRVTNATAEDASSLVAALHRLGIEPELVARSLTRLSSSLAQGKDALADFGIQTVLTADGNVDLIETFLSIADRVQALGPGLAANNLAVEVFGQKVANQLLPALQKGRQGIEDLRAAAAEKGLSFSQEDLDRVSEFKSAQKDLTDTLKGLEVELGREVIPLVTAFVKVVGAAAGKVITLLGPVIEAGRFIADLADRFGLGIDSTEGLADATEFLTGGLDGLGDSIEETNAKIEAQIEAQTSLLDLNLQVEAANRRLTRSQDAVLDAENKLAEVRHGTPAELKAQEAATRSLADANADFAKIQEDLARLQRTEAKRAAELVEKANIGMLRATDALDDAIRDEAEAQRELNEARAAGGDPEKLAQAEERIADAVTNVARARRELAIAESRVIAGRDAKSIADSVEANARVAEANERVREAQEAEAKARQEQDAVRAEGADFIRDKEEAAEDASLRVRDARLGVVTATAAVTEAERQQREGTDELVAAQEKAEGAALKVKDATDKLREANEALIPKTGELREAERDLEEARAGVIESAIAVAKAHAAQRVATEEATGKVVTAIEKQQILREELGKVATALGADSPFGKNIRERTRDLKGLADQIVAVTTEAQALSDLILNASGANGPGVDPATNDAGLSAILGQTSTTKDTKSVGMRPIELNIYETTSPRETGREAVRSLKAWSDVAVGR